MLSGFLMNNTSNNTYLSQIIKRTISLAKLEIEHQNLNGNLSLRTAILDSLPLSLFVHDVEGNILYANKKALEISNINKEDLQKHNFYSMDKKLSRELQKQRISKLFQEGRINFVIDNFSDDSRSTWKVEEKIIELNDEKIILSMVKDSEAIDESITHSKGHEKSLGSLKMKVDHEKELKSSNISPKTSKMVKDNLDLISSLINLQSRYSKDDVTVNVFREIQNRVRAITLAHEKLGYSNEHSQINFAEYVRGLIRRLFDSYNDLIKDIDLKININPVYLDMETLIPCGLIINELVTNSIKYAFSNGKGQIKVIFNSKDDYYSLTVKDNGSGFPNNIDFTKTDTLGLQLVNNLTYQLNGKIKQVKGPGTTFHITFPKNN